MKILLLMTILVSVPAFASDYCSELRDRVAAGQPSEKPQLSDRDLKCLGFGEACARVRGQVMNSKISGSDAPDLDEADEGCLRGEVNLTKFI
jgi:hypothetical protein